jgi:putative glutamine amidotransferase
MHPGTGTETVKFILTSMGVRVTTITKKEQIDRLKYDGLVLLGGSDINPALYGESMRYTHKIDLPRDQIEWRLLRRAMTKRIPILGICRGHQLLSVAYGGSLYQDIFRQKKTGYHPSTHRVRLSGEMIRHAASDLVNSYHHQAVRIVPDGFKVLAKSDDQIIESIWKPGVLGIQWHPELMYSYDRRWSEIFRWFVNGLE